MTWGELEPLVAALTPSDLHAGLQRAVRYLVEAGVDVSGKLRELRNFLPGPASVGLVDLIAGPDDEIDAQYDRVAVALTVGDPIGVARELDLLRTLQAEEARSLRRAFLRTGPLLVTDLDGAQAVARRLLERR